MKQRKEHIASAKSFISSAPAAAASSSVEIEPVLLAIQDMMQTDFTIDYLPKVINDLKTIENLSHLNIDEINDALRAKIEKISFDIDQISKESKVAGILAKWIINVKNALELKRSLKLLNWKI